MKSKKYIIAIAVIIVAAALVCVCYAGWRGLINVPFIHQKNEQMASGDAGEADDHADTDTASDADVVDQDPTEMTDYSSYADGTAAASDDSDDEDDYDDEDDDSDYSDADYIFPDSSDESISADDIADLSNEDLRIAINEIYARHGYCFPASQEMRDYFDGKDWYEPDPDVDDMTKVKLSKTEKKNIDKMSKERQKRKDNGDYPY